MNKSEWMPVNGEQKAGQRKLLEYLVGQSIKYPMKIGDATIQCVVLSQFVEILKELSGENNDDALCDSSCELYDGRICDCKRNCNRRQVWLRDKDK
jgi:hypothetical protein